MADSDRNLLIIQLGTTSELINTYLSCLSVKEEYPDTKLILIAKSEAVNSIRFLLKRVFHTTLELDVDDILRSRDSYNYSISRVKKISETINGFNPFVVVNLSYTRVSAYLASLVKTHNKLGMYCNNHGEIVIKDLWSQYFYSTVMTGSLNPFHLVDLYRYSIGSSAARPIINKNGSPNQIAIHPFSRDEKSSFKIEKWGEIIFKILNDLPNVTINLIGNPCDKLKSEKLVGLPILNMFKNRIINRIAVNTVEEISNVIKGCSLFIGHESLFGYIASTVGTKSLTIALGGFRPEETVPWGDGNIVLMPRTSCYPCFRNDTCAHLKCHSDIPYQVVTEITSQLITKGDINYSDLTKKISSFHLEGCDVAKTKIMDNGFLKLIIENDVRPSKRNILLSLYRILWLYTFSKTEEKVSFPKLSAETYDSLMTYLRGLESTVELANFGKKFSKYILEELTRENPSIEDIKKYSAKIEEIEKLLDTLSSTYAGLNPMIKFYRFARMNLLGDNLVELTENSFLSFEDQRISAGTLLELLEKSLAQYRHTC